MDVPLFLGFFGVSEPVFAVSQNPPGRRYHGGRWRCAPEGPGHGLPWGRPAEVDSGSCNRPAVEPKRYMVYVILG